MTENEIKKKLHAVLEVQFEIEPQQLRPDARLYEDLGIDSIDAVDLIIQLKEVTGMRIPPERFKNVRTIGDVSAVLTELKVT